MPDALNPRKALDLAFWPVIVVARHRAAARLRRLLRDGGADPLRDLLRDQPDVVARARHGRPVLVRDARVRGRRRLPVRLALDQPRTAVVGVRARSGSPSGRSAGCSSRCRRCACKGVYFALLTIGLVEACNQYVTSDTDNLGGAQGLVGADSIIPPSKQGLIEGYYYAYIAIAVIVGIALLVYWWVSSGQARAAPAHGARVRAGRPGARHQHPARAPRGVRHHRRRARARRRVPRGLRRRRQQERVQLLAAAAAVRDDRRRRHQLAQGHPARDGAAALDRAALRRAGTRRG